MLIIAVPTKGSEEEGDLATWAWIVWDRMGSERLDEALRTKGKVRRSGRSPARFS